jgi:hypothetical protein
MSVHINKGRERNKNYNEVRKEKRLDRLDKLGN